ncbi:MAG: 3-hydroxyacyl-CoA dehydrogenase NAD-binding domain-containing protein [Armatimonadota bacterium]|nr:3-hydroxyacyl-CoA dehydrogenase NAD-binding domain-containing protein [Armatimonadota bacterium]
MARPAASRAPLLSMLVDTALEQRYREGQPIRVALVGAGYMGRGIALQIVSAVPGLRLVAIANRTVSEAERAYRQAGVERIKHVDDPGALERAIASGQYAVTRDPHLLAEAKGIDALIEATGEVEFATRVVVGALQRRKHVILMNAELDATLGPILKVYADRTGVVITNADGDQPGVIMNLYRYVKAMGYRPVLAGNIKGMIDPHRTPETQRAFAEAHRQRAQMVTAFADGTKLALEMAVVANATGFRVGRRGMYGPRCAHVTEAPRLFRLDELLAGGLVDYVLGAEPGPGVFVLGYNDDPIKQEYMRYFKMGDGPVYVFYTPYHLPHLEVPFTVARAVLFGDATIAPLKGPVCEVVALAKRDLAAGTTLDGIGGFAYYGVIENAEACRRDRLLPVGLAAGCRLVRAVRRDEPIALADVELPDGRLADRLRAEQDATFAPVERQVLR